MAQTTVARALTPTRGRIVAVAAAVLALAAAVPATPVHAHGGAGLRAAANQYRTDHEVKAVFGTDLLDDISTQRARQMANANRLEHDMEYVGNRLDRSGVCWSGFGEIIAWERGYPDYSYDRTMGMWWNSPPHRDVLMNPDFNAAGGAWATADDGGNYSVMVFVTLCSGTVVRRLALNTVYDPDREMVIGKGERVGYKLSARGRVLDRKRVTFDSRREALSAGRSSVDETRYLKVNSGALDGYWVRESSEVFVRGFAKRTSFDPERKARFEDGQYTGFHFSPGGRVTERHRSTLKHATRWSIDARAIINGEPYLRVASGRLGGYWVRDTSHVKLL